VKWKSISANHVRFLLPGNPPQEVLDKIEAALKSKKSWIAYVEVTQSGAIALTTHSSKVRKNFTRYMNRVCNIMIDEIVSKRPRPISQHGTSQQSHQSKRKPPSFVKKPATAL
jgi:hypothetical protein